MLGLVSAFGGAGRARLEWRVPPAAEPELAAFVHVGTDRAALFTGAGRAVDLAEGGLVVGGLTDGTRYFAGLAVAPEPGLPAEPVGPVLELRAGPPIYVDAAADPGVADGTTPATAHDDLVLAMLLAFSAGGGNVWVAAGQFDDVSLPLFDGVHVTGGFAPGFVPEERDPAAHPTTLAGLAGVPVVSVQLVVTQPVLDGFVLDGRGVAPTGVDVVASPFEGRRLVITGCSRGLKARNSEVSPAVPFGLVDASVDGNGIEGLSLEGPFDVLLDACTFRANGHEGVDFGPWVAPAGATVRATVRACDFLGNGSEGLDVDMAAPSGASGPGGRFELTATNCDFHANALAGLLLDIDFETAPGWSAGLAVLGGRASGNGAEGVHLDLDARSEVFVHRLESSANVGDGLLATSESAPGTLVVCASAFVGNQGAGARAALGNVGLLASHCLFAGNAAGGLVSGVVRSSAASSVANLQAAPWSGAQSVGCVAQGAFAPPLFLRSPRELSQVTGLAGSALVVPQAPSAGLGALAELANDGFARRLVGLADERVELDPAPTFAFFPTVLAIYADGDAVEDDLRLAPGSAAARAGMVPPVGALVDAGPFGAPFGGPPGFDEAERADAFRLARTSPPWSLPVAAGAEFALEFQGGAPDAATLAQGVSVADASGAPRSAVAFVDGARIRVAAPSGGWSEGDRIELHAALRSMAGAALAAPVALPLRVR